MANTGFDWGSWAFVQVSAADWDADAINHGNDQTSDAISLDVKAACEMPYVQNGTRYRTFSIDPSKVGGCKILVTFDGGAGSSVTTSLKIRTADIPAAS